MYLVEIQKLKLTKQKRRYLISGITFMKYVQRQKIGMQNDLKVFGSKKSKHLTIIAKISYGKLCLLVGGQS
jgi:hypothetical protein